MLPACLLGYFLHNVMRALLPALPAVLLTGTILVGAEVLFLLTVGLAKPRWVKILVRRS